MLSKALFSIRMISEELIAHEGVGRLVPEHQHGNPACVVRIRPRVDLVQELGALERVLQHTGYRPAESELSRERLKSALSTAEGLLLQPRSEGGVDRTIAPRLRPSKGFARARPGRSAVG